MTTKVKDRILNELEDFPENKIESLIDYMHFLKQDNKIKIPNKETEQTFKDTDTGKNLNSYNSVDEFFEKMES